MEKGNALGGQQDINLNDETPKGFALESGNQAKKGKPKANKAGMSRKQKQMSI